MSIVIFTVRPTILTIDTSGVPELLKLEEMGHEERTRSLTAGVSQIALKAGVFRVLSNHSLTATADIPDTHIVEFTKDGGSPDPPKMTINLDTEPVRSFIAAAMGAPAPF